ncbi:MAG: hypothetical protein KatS3mg121_1029 [Gammaproteobacteria bacterium]|nr:MAG: hypothetical protein KatS3mg121_1029 [Gammaproteobacteria bacterium]
MSKKAKCLGVLLAAGLASGGVAAEALIDSVLGSGEHQGAHASEPSGSSPTPGARPTAPAGPDAGRRMNKAELIDAIAKGSKARAGAPRPKEDAAELGEVEPR